MIVSLGDRHEGSGRTIPFLENSDMSLEFREVIPRPNLEEPQVSIYVNKTIYNWRPKDSCQVNFSLVKRTEITQ